MALTPLDELHALQIQAGTLGRKAGHLFEDTITREINSFGYPFQPVVPTANAHVFNGDPATLLLSYIAAKEGFRSLVKVVALSTGALATSEEGKRWLCINGATFSRCKSDLVVTLHSDDGRSLTIGVSTKQCENESPTNAQLYFTTARGFAGLLQANGISVSDTAIAALRQFCGDLGFRPTDTPSVARGRLTDPRRYFWEEINAKGRHEWEELLSYKQDPISLLLFQKAYMSDPFVPQYILHKTKKAVAWNKTEVAIYSVNELIALSRRYQGFTTRPYSVKKGSYKDPAGVTHLAPRFGIIQMQRGGQRQHPEQLQFNLEAGYFYKI